VLDSTNFVSLGLSGGPYIYIQGPTSGGTIAIAETLATPLINQEDKTTGNGATLTIAAQTSLGGNGNGGTLALAGGSPHGTGRKGGVRLSLDETSAEPMVEVAEVATGRRAVVLGLGAAVRRRSFLRAPVTACCTSPTMRRHPRPILSADS